MSMSVNSGPQPAHVYCCICGGDITKQFSVVDLRGQTKHYYDMCKKCGQWLKTAWDYWDGQSPRKRGGRK